MLVPRETLILALDGARMQLLRNCGAGDQPTLEVMVDEVCPSPPSRDLVTDRPGRGFESVGARRHAYSEGDAHQQREQNFARNAVKALQSAATNGAGIILVAPPRTLGELRRLLDTPLKERVLAEIGKDIAHFRPSEISTFLQEYWPKPQGMA